MPGIDPDLFWDNETGECFVQWSYRPDCGGISIGQARIDLEQGTLLEVPRIIWSGSGGLGPEGPHLFQIDDYYYLMIAEGGTEYGHMVTIARSRSVTGPYESCPRNPVLTHRSSGHAVQAVGHADLVQLPGGEWAGVCLGIRPRGYHKFHVLGRETFGFHVNSKSEDGWPEFGNQGKLPEKVPTPLTGPNHTDFKDHFERQKFPLEWTWLKNPLMHNYVRRDGKLVLIGTRDSLDGHGQPTWIGLRQRNHRFRLEIQMQIQFPEAAGGEAGICVYQNFQTHACVGFKRTQGSFSLSALFYRLRLQDIVVEQESDSLSTSAQEHPTFIVEGDDLEYRFLVRSAGSEGVNEIFSFPAKMLSTEFAGRFTGVFLALYAEGDAQLMCRRIAYKAEIE